MDLSTQLTAFVQLSKEHREKSGNLLIKILENILKYPNNHKYRDLNLIKICNKLQECKICIGLLFNAGFEKSINGKRLILNNAKSLNTLKLLHNNLLHIISNNDERWSEENELMEDLDCLLSESEQLRSNDDEVIMDTFSDLGSILCESNAITAYIKYLESKHNEEFIYLWLDLNKYSSDYHILSKHTQKRFVIELYEKYIKSNGKLNTITSKYRSNIKKQIESGLIEGNMFNEIQYFLSNYLNRDSYQFFNSSQYFRFIITYNYKETDNKMLNEYLETKQLILHSKVIIDYWWRERCLNNNANLHLNTKWMLDIIISVLIKISALNQGFALFLMDGLE